MSETVADEIKKKILRERNIIVGASNMKKKTSNASVIQKCNSNIQEAQQNIDYLNERLNQLKLQQDNGSTQNEAISADVVKKTPYSSDSKFLRLDLMKYDCPSLGQRIQYMINQLDTKLKLEQKYYEANEKLSKIYQMDGDRRISSVAEDGRIQSNHKIQLLKKSLRRYEDINISLDHIEQDDDALNNVKFRNKASAGTLTIGINSIRDVDHIASPLFARKTESFISIKIDDEEKVRSKGSRSDKWNEEFKIHIDKGNEIEITIYDKISGSFVPVAIGWFLISDIAEEIRRKKVGQSGVGWVSASRIQSGSRTHNPNTVDNFTLNEKEPVENSKEPLKSSAWFVLEPAGQILLTFGYTKSTVPNKKTLLGGLHRHGAIRKRDEEVFEQHGHQFVQKQFYSIMRCALCGDFLPYNGYQCQDCKFLCHKKCYEKVITKCISKSSTDIDPDELKLNHRIPHRFEQYSNRGTNWCCHCGNLLPWGRKNVLKCSECETMCHSQCSHLVPDFCGMSMETANEILKTIKSTEGTRKRQVQDFNKRQSNPSSGLTAVDSEISTKSRLAPSKQSSVIPDTRAEYEAELPQLPTQSFNQPQPQAYDQQRSSLSDYENLREQHRQQQPEPQPQVHPQYDDQTQSQALDKAELQRYLEEQERLQEEQILYEQDRLKQEQLLQQQYQNQQQQQHLYHHQQDLLQQQSDLYSEHQDLSFQQDYEDLSASNRQSQYSEKSSQHDARQSMASKASKNSYEVANPVLETPTQTDVYSPPSVDSHQQSSIPSVVAPSHHTHTPKEKRHRTKVGLDDFNFITVLGRGNFGKVMLARSNHTKKLCAVKILKKDMIIDNGEIASLQAEKEVFKIANSQNHPFLTNLHCCFQTANRIYFVMEYVSGGDLMWHVQQGNFSLRRAKFYAAEVLLALEYLHENGIVYRDLKLDNIMLSTEGHIKLADYGLCKRDMGYSKTTNTFCGTPEFMAPEILKEQNYTRSVDWWAFGVLVYQMLLGKSPFRGEDEDEVFNAILTDEPLFPIQMASEAVGLLESLLDKNPQTRLGSGPRDAEEIKEHPYFRNIDFDEIRQLRVPPPYIPQVKSEEDTSFFDKDFTSEIPRLTPVNSVLDSASQMQFRGFSYVNERLEL